MEAPGQFEIFQYPAGPDSPFPDWDGCWGSTQVHSGAADKHTHEATLCAAEAKVRAEFEQRLAGETKRSFEAGCERGRLEGLKAQCEAHASADAANDERHRQQVATLMARFTEERDRFLQAVELEVVKLALAVAARILRREAQMDPLLLTGAVRVALGQLAATTEVRLRVPEAELDLWTEAISLLPNLALKPAVEVKEGMRLGDCEIETGMGSVDLGIRAQLGEIERGFFDRAGGNRAVPAAASPRPSSQDPGGHS